MMRCRRPNSSWHLFLLLHAPQYQRFNTLETIFEEPNEANIGFVTNKREHRCQTLLKNQLHRESVDKSLNPNKIKDKLENEEKIADKEESDQKCRKQWETSPDQMKEISRSLSHMNGTNGDKKDSELVRSKRSTKTLKEKSSEKHTTTRTTLPPINTFSDSDSGKEFKELTYSCICEEMYKSKSDPQDLNPQQFNESNQWVVSRPIRQKPSDNLRLDGPMEMDTTFKTTYDTTAKQMNADSVSRNVAVVMPSHKPVSEESNFERLKKTKTNELNAVKSSKKKSKNRPSTSLKAGGDGYFNTINQESYKNFVIIDGNAIEKAKSSTNGKKSGVCCASVGNVKLPKVEEKMYNKRMTREEKSTQLDDLDKSMKSLTTEEYFESKTLAQKPISNGIKFADSCNQTNDNLEKGCIKSKTIEAKSDDKNLMDSQHRNGETIKCKEGANSWTINALEEPKQLMTRDVDNIKNMGIMEKPQIPVVFEVPIQRVDDKQEMQTKVVKELSSDQLKDDDTTRVRNESKHYVQSQRRHMKHKNESSMRFFDGDMDFTTTSKASFADKSPVRGERQPNGIQRVKTAGKRSRKNGRKGNLFRTSTEAEFNETYGEKSADTTYHKEFSDHLYCPAIDLGSNKSEFTFKGESSGHKFFLPAVKY